MDTDDVKLWVGGCFSTLFVALSIFLVYALLLQAMWNALVPSLFHLREIAYTEALMLMGICTVLFKDMPSVSLSSSKSK